MITRLANSSLAQDLPKYRSMLAGNAAYLPPSFESIASATGTGSSNTITFSSIPGTYQHLQIRYIGKSTTSSPAGVAQISMQLNSDTGANYTRHRLIADGVSASAIGVGGVTSFNFETSIPNSDVTLANMHGVGVFDIHDYASTSKNKTLRGFSGSDVNGQITSYLSLSSGLWFATPAVISSITLTLSSGSWTTTSQFALYGIKGA